ncbi:hypothetical protein [Fodinibius salsisoli]|uniref:Uncharacterized protein n=1 Tax=Fodinibius salsisoli TaxID=2820877 RepID=A0ABT3PQ98_9BACT|nr:hypothetical protein [Fodinibius salsisoli]MCW9708037.1 hypothetical protein [Fodinibius salsisoli]
MNRYPANIIAFIGILTFLTSCSLFNDDDPERTYPRAFDFEVTSLQNLVETQPTDSLNVEVYVTDIMLERDCSNAPYALCFGDGIFVSDTKNPGEENINYPIGVDNPRQFQQGQRYRMSFSIEYTGTDDQYTSRRFMGYSKID